MLNQTTPKAIDSQCKAIATSLGLDIGLAEFLAYAHEERFSACEQFCHLNCKRMMQFEDGEIIFGWVLWQDKKQKFIEAEFHSVWKTKNGTLKDITPRIDREETILFIPDKKRKVIFPNILDHIISYLNHKMHGNRVTETTTSGPHFVDPENLQRIGLAH